MRRSSWKYYLSTQSTKLLITLAMPLLKYISMLNHMMMIAIIETIANIWDICYQNINLIISFFNLSKEKFVQMLLLVYSVINYCTYAVKKDIKLLTTIAMPLLQCIVFNYKMMIAIIATMAMNYNVCYLLAQHEFSFF